jgi:lipid-A-disaccharide synthase
MADRTYKIMIVAGEASGDLHAAKLVKAFHETRPDAVFEFFGAAGERMRSAGVDATIDSDGLSIVGLPEIARALPKFLRVFNTLKREALRRNPDCVVLVDFPDFNLRLARALGKRGLKIVYYISPQLWAWRQYRIKTVRKYVDLVISILPFEKSWYSARGVEHVEYVGSPLTREVHPTIDKAEFCRKHQLDAGSPIVSLLPGSRHKEIVRILPVMLETAALMLKTNPSIQFVIPIASERNRLDVDAAIDSTNLRDRLTIVLDQTFDALNASDVAAVTSGTATLETGIIGTPMTIVYKTSALNYKLLRPLIDVEHFGLINLIAEDRVAQELIQDDFTPQTLAADLFRLLEPQGNALMRERLGAAVDKLGHGGASRRAAEAILKLIDEEA